MEPRAEAMDEPGAEAGNEQGEQAPNNNQQKRKPKAKEKFKEPKIKWGKSKARDLLFQDLVDRKIPRQAVNEHNKSIFRLSSCGE
jgi:hypothetical protein